MKDQEELRTDLNRLASDLLDGKEVDRLELANALTAAAEMLSFLRPPEASIFEPEGGTTRTNE